MNETIFRKRNYAVELDKVIYYFPALLTGIYSNLILK